MSTFRGQRPDTASRAVALAGWWVLVISGCHLDDGMDRKLLVFCGSASLPAMEECRAVFEEETGVRVEMQCGGSGAMLSRLKMARRGDLFIPGSHDYMLKATRQGVVDPDSVKILAYLVPAILVPEGNPKGIASLGDLKRPGVSLGIGNPRSVCVGLYAIEILDKARLLDDLQAHITVHAESCAKTAALVALGKVDAIIGWRIFGHWNPDKIGVVPLPAEQIPRIAYVPVGICRASSNPAAAREFIRFLTGVRGRSIFARHGYLTSAAEARRLAPRAEVGGEAQMPADDKPGSVGEGSRWTKDKHG